MTKKNDRTEPYSTSEIAGRIGQLIGYLQLMFIPIVAWSISEKYAILTPKIVIFGMILILMMTILIIKGKQLEGRDVDPEHKKRAALWSIVAAVVSSALYLPFFGLSLIYVAAIICFARAYRRPA
jgi:hypothetical protein